MCVCVCNCLIHADQLPCTSPLQQYDPELDRKQFEEEVRKLNNVPAAQAEMARMHVVDHATFERASMNAATKV